MYIHEKISVKKLEFVLPDVVDLDILYILCECLLKFEQLIILIIPTTIYKLYIVGKIIKLVFSHSIVQLLYQCINLQNKIINKL